MPCKIHWNFWHFLQKFEIAELCKEVHCVDLGESFQTHIFLQNFVSIQPRTSLLKFVNPLAATARYAAWWSPCTRCMRRAFPLPLPLPSGREGPLRSGKLDRARSRLYRNEILQEHMRLKALAEIYTMHSFAQLYNHIFSKKMSRILPKFAKIFRNFAEFCKILQKKLAKF